MFSIGYIRLVQQHRQKVVDKWKGKDSTVLPSYGLIPAISLELLFRLAGIHVFSALCFSGPKKHLD
jgi:hypothetical protein